MILYYPFQDNSHKLMNTKSRNPLAMFKKIVEIDWLYRRRYMSEQLELNDFFRWNGVKKLYCSNVVSLQF
ncbi:hypothetical protein CFOLD11_42870 [Clostridium folliculivorans]|uniref:Uncharacterized protein n=1 Tax=Clostridium folliculivorans TaxID=2886038 RepID=A0A9W5Y6H0_9CLOT|nr:hypothetical protein CFOLD11_42870 [Clostridium folliculivorans]